jgi:hypothetical protein
MQCAYCGKPATHIDLCHQLVPVCNAHQGTGHQLGALPVVAPKAKAKG